MSLDSMKIIKTIRTHSEPVNTLLVCKNGNFVSGSLGRIIFYSKENFEVILRITEFKEYYFSHIYELHIDNTFLLSYSGFKIIQTTNDNRKYKVLFSFYERFIMNKAIEYEYKYISKDNKETIKYNILISSVYGIHIFEKTEKNEKNDKNNKIDTNSEKNDINQKIKIESDNSDLNYTFVKKLNFNEIIYNILQISNNCFISTSNSVLASGNNCLRFWSYSEMSNFKTINNLYCSSGVNSVAKVENMLLVGLEKIPKYLFRSKIIDDKLNINGIAVIDLENYEVVQFIETHNCIRSLLLAKNNTIIVGSTFNLLQYRFNRGIMEKIGEKELFNYINNVIIEIDNNTFVTGSNDKKIIVIK